MDKISIFILLFKVKNYSERWIVKYSDNYSELKNIITDIDNKDHKIGNYYIITKLENVSLLDEKFKQFQIYIPSDHDKLLFSY